MVTNTSEYQKEYQREYRKTHPQKQYRKSKEVKIGSKEVKKNKMLEISLERLRPPREVEKETVGLSHHIKDGSEKPNLNERQMPSVDSNTSEMDPFLWLSSNHSFQMVILELMKKFAPGFKEFGIKTRGKKEVLKNSFSNARRDLIIELKEVLKKRNERK